MALTERPYRYSFSLNEIRYVFQLADPSRAGLYLQVRINYAPIGSGTFTELYSFKLKPTADGLVYAYIQAYLDSVVDYVLPVMDAVLTDANAQCVQYYIDFREIEDADPDPDYTTTESDHIRLAIKGGIEQHKHSRNNFFINYLDTDKPFLTWQPAGRFFYAGESVLFSFLNKNAETEYNNTKIKVLTKYADGTSTTEVLTVTCDKLLMHVLPFNELTVPDTTAENKVYYYEFSIVSNDESTTIINAYRLYVQYRPAYTYYDLLYINSLGGMSNIRIVKDVDINYDRTVTEAEQGPDLNAWQNKNKKHQRAHASILLNRKHSGNIGVENMNTQQQREAMMDLLASEKVFMVVEDLLVPVLSIQESILIGNRKSLENGLPIQWVLSESNEVYTPSTQSFGQGTDTETY